MEPPSTVYASGHIFVVLRRSLARITSPSPRRHAASPSQPASYVPGIYTSSITLGSQNLNVEVAVDAQQIQSVCFVSLDEAVTTMYPLMQPVMEDLADQIVKNQSTQNLSYSLETRYTSQSLIGAIDRALEKAKVRN